MKKAIWLIPLTALLMPALSMAQSVFDGTWKVDMSTAKFPEKPDVYLLQNGVYKCKTCVPPLDVKADGKDHAVSGHPYYDTVSIKVVDDRTIEETDKKNGKTVSTSTAKVSDDGNTMMFEFSDSSAGNGATVTGKGQEARVAKGPEGSHAISGSWKMAKLEDLSENATTFTYEVNGDSLTMTSPTGQGYTARLDGTEAPYHGDPGTTSVSVKKIGANGLEGTDKRNGKITSVERMTVSADGKTMKIVADDKLRGTHSEVTVSKQ